MSSRFFFGETPGRFCLAERYHPKPSWFLCYAISNTVIHRREWSSSITPLTLSVSLETSTRVDESPVLHTGFLQPLNGLDVEEQRGEPHLSHGETVERQWRDSVCRHRQSCSGSICFILPTLTLLFHLIYFGE